MNRGIKSSSVMKKFMSNSKEMEITFFTTDCKKTAEGMMFMSWTESKMLANHNVTTHFEQISITLYKKHFTKTSLYSQWQIFMGTLC